MGYIQISYRSFWLLAVGFWDASLWLLADWYGRLIFFLLTANSQQPTANSLKEAQIPNE
ncbi:hypothetical protein N9F27_03520 [Crocinitomicaceae bacterium]|nr:hypothetical protein [Crocinitomicaceae bacterium]